MLTEREWEKFFEFLNKIVNASLPYDEKIERVEEKAAENGGELNLEEFSSWFIK